MKVLVPKITSIIVIGLCLIECQEPLSPIISLNTKEINLDYKQTAVSIQYVIENHNGNELSAYSSDDWISGIVIQKDVVSFFVDENNSGRDRNGTFILKYPGASDVYCSINQSWSAPEIVLSSQSATFEYGGGGGSFSYSINNPREDVELVVSCESDWVTNLTKTDNIVTFSVPENNSGSARSSILYLRYGTYTETEYTINQSWSAPKIVLSSQSATFEYGGGGGSFSYSINNPREDVELVVSCESDWVTNLTKTDKEISYRVSGHSSYSSRNAIINLSYQGFTSTVFAVTQNGEPVSLLSLNKNSIELLSGNSETLIATVIPIDAPLQWSSNNPSVAIVDQSGIVSAIGNGSAIISVSTDDGKSASCSVSVTTSVTSVSLNKTELCLSPSESEALIATVYPSNASNKTVVWSTTNKDVVSVDNSGRITAIKNGESTIVVTSVDGNKTADCVVTVTTPVSDVSLNKAALSLTPGEMETLVATVSPMTASNKAINWTSSDNKVAIVDDAGTVTAKSNGVSIITATTESGNKTATCEVSVTTPVSGVSLNKDFIKASSPGERFKLFATIDPITASDQSVSWTSSDESVAYVDSDGVVICTGDGSAVITVITNDGQKTATCTFNVSIPPRAVNLGQTKYVNGIKYMCYWAECNVGAINPEAAGGYYAWAETYSKSEYSTQNYRWLSSINGRLTRYCPDTSTGIHYWDGVQPDGATDLKHYNYVDDVAGSALSRWHTPTENDWSWLGSNCSWEWTSVNGVKGYRITSKIEGYTNNSIFIPAAGYMDSQIRGKGIGGYYWTSAINPSNPLKAYYLYIYNASPGGRSINQQQRYMGLTVRAIYSGY